MVVLLASLGAALVLLAGATAYRFDDDFAAKLPPLPPKPTVADAKEVLRSRDFSPAMYRAFVEQDAQAAGVPAPPGGVPDRPFDYETSSQSVVLKPGERARDMGRLRLSVYVENLNATSTSGSYRTKHLVLRIENRTDEYLAYQIATRPKGGAQMCGYKGDLAHNAIALAPHESVERTECLFRESMNLAVERTETLAVPPFSYHYVSRLHPPHLGMDTRATRGHRASQGAPCLDIPEQTIRVGLDKGQVTWRDVVDFYARHRCETYLFPVGYRAFTRPAQYRLPVAQKDVEGRAP